ncbi:MAG: hypothetical protein H6553_13795 [Chitinophagales bacterium]|nr:hypothetical protein [Chitinophagales bacterium]
MKYKYLVIIILIFNCVQVSAKNDSISIIKRHNIGGNMYYNKHNQYFTNGFMFDVNYEYVFNRWIGLQTSLGFNRAKRNLNDWKENYLDGINGSISFDKKVPSLTSSILLNIKGNFYCINNTKSKLKLGLAIEYRNITDVITSGIVDLQPNGSSAPELIITQTFFEQYNDLGISSNICYTYILKNNIGLNFSFGYNHYFTDLSKRAYDREKNEKYRTGGSSFLKAGIGISYQF